MESFKAFGLHIAIFSGALFWLLIGTIVFGNYQVGWKSPTGYTETVVNQVNEESLMRQTMAQQAMDSSPRYKK